MDLFTWVPITLILGLGSFAIIVVFIVACEKV